MWPVAGSESYRHAKFHLDPFNRLATIQFADVTDRQDRQRSDSIGRAVLQTTTVFHRFEYITTFSAYITACDLDNSNFRRFRNSLCMGPKNFRHQNRNVSSIPKTSSIHSAVFYRTPACDGRTDRQTPYHSIYHAHMRCMFRAVKSGHKTYRSCLRLLLAIIRLYTKFEALALPVSKRRGFQNLEGGCGVHHALRVDKLPSLTEYITSEVNYSGRKPRKINFACRMFLQRKSFEYSGNDL